MRAWVAMCATRVFSYFPIQCMVCVLIAPSMERVSIHFHFNSMINKSHSNISMRNESWKFNFCKLLFGQQLIDTLRCATREIKIVWSLDACWVVNGVERWQWWQRPTKLRFGTVRQNKHKTKVDNVAFVGTVTLWRCQTALQLLRDKQASESGSAKNLAQVKISTFHAKTTSDRIVLVASCMPCARFYFSAVRFIFPIIFRPNNNNIFSCRRHPHIRHRTVNAIAGKRSCKRENFCNIVRCSSCDGQRTSWTSEWRSAARWNGKWDERKAKKLWTQRIKCTESIIHMLEIYMQRDTWHVSHTEIRSTKNAWQPEYYYIAIMHCVLAAGAQHNACCTQIACRARSEFRGEKIVRAQPRQNRIGGGTNTVCKPFIVS